jgi:alkylhydroperoxidase family enzyme
MRLRPILRYARKLTREPATVTADDAAAVYAAGWDEKALHDAILVVCVFNFMNRLLEGHGIHGSEELYQSRGPMLKSTDTCR